MLERDRQASETRLQEETLCRVGIEARILSRLQKPLGFKDTFDGKMNEEGLYGDSRPLSSILKPEMIEEVDALAHLSILDPDSMGNAIPFNYGYDLVAFNEGHLRPNWAEARVRNLEDAKHSVGKLQVILDTANQRAREILDRKQTGVVSDFDEVILEIFLKNIRGEDIEPGQVVTEANLLDHIKNRRETLDYIQNRVDRALTRIEQVAQELSVYKNIPHEEAVTIVLQLYQTFRQPHMAQTIEQAGAEDHVERCGYPLCSMFHPLYGYFADILNPEQKAAILAEIEQQIEQQ